MKTILVSGASGIVGYGILRSLRKTHKNLTLIGTTIYEDSAAQGFCDIFEKAVRTDDPHYIQWLTEGHFEKLNPSPSADWHLTCYVIAYESVPVWFF